VKIAIMQPYLFPYIGYFQLIHDVDLFVIHDDVQYIKGGWINRNRILVNGGEEYLFTFSLQKSSSSAKINERFFSKEIKNEKLKFLRMIEHSYKRAPFFYNIKPIIQDIMDYEQRNISDFISYSLKVICEYLEIKTPFIYSSCIDKNDNLKGEARVIDINKSLHSTCYINPIGGVELYSKSRFKQEGIDLYFLKPKLIHYKQFNSDFVPWLSIIDVLMFNSKDTIRTFLDEYELI
jgi:hypothetical protein